MKHVAIIGAGPAGLAAAETLSANGLRVTIFERMPSPARKFLMAGRGGLNLTHSEALETFLPRYGASAANLTRYIEAHPPVDVVAWAEGLGQETFAGSSGRIFPKAMKASPLLRAWLRRLDAHGVEIKLRHTWTGWSDDGQPLISNNGAPPAPIACDATILALGGASWPRLGSDGAWRETLVKSGITVTPLVASNCGLLIGWSDHFRTRYAGEPIKRLAVTFEGDTQRGEAVITRQGLEGGAVYALSSTIAARTHGGGWANIVLDLKPDEPHDIIANRLRRPRGKDSVANWLRKCLKLSPAAIGLLREASRDLPNSPDDLARLIKALPLTVIGTSGLDRAISTAGGVAFDDLDDNLMLRARPGTFVAGEMLDWDAPTGGYLLQATLATGTAAAHGVIAWLDAT
ncbi:MAG: aminoacetone oxidase family FAD-binding enzyme [Hyphomicrobium sp.]|nr:aminoacetone oxidase family FAD-binding enzyme [Hyphomicrobium sp.]PPD06186.1 MAG: aminoacetone oxidase family FAD-binding enzyme [Hyphomicrobium sp.]